MPSIADVDVKETRLIDHQMPQMSTRLHGNNRWVQQISPTNGLFPLSITL
jgi:hypothetical protein